MTDFKVRSFDVIVDISKQIIVLSTGLIALSITFGKTFAKDLETVSRWPFAVSWVLLLISIAAAIWTMMACAGALGKSTESMKPDPNSKPVRVPGLALIISFMLGLLFMTTGGWFVLYSSA